MTWSSRWCWRIWPTCWWCCTWGSMPWEAIEPHVLELRICLLYFAGVWACSEWTDNLGVAPRGSYRVMLQKSVSSGTNVLQLWWDKHNSKVNIYPALGKMWLYDRVKIECRIVFNNEEFRKCLPLTCPGRYVHVVWSGLTLLWMSQLKWRRYTQARVWLLAP